MTTPPLFELVDYDQLSNIKIPLVMGLWTNGKCSLKGVLTELSAVKGPKLFDDLLTHMVDNAELFDNQRLMTIKDEVVGGGVVLYLMPLVNVNKDGTIRTLSEMPDVGDGIPVAYSKNGSEYINYFDGSKPFHENYLELVTTIDPIIELRTKLVLATAVEQ